jgi:hypothetical protein
VIKFVHTLSRDQGTDKFISQVKHFFYLRNLGRKVRTSVLRCDICQGVKHPNRSHEVEARSHLPGKHGELLSIDLYGPLPIGCAGINCILVCLDVFAKRVKLHPPRPATKSW